MSAQLAQLGLRIHSVEADGNCFFRSLADQLSSKSSWIPEDLDRENGEITHAALRKFILGYVKKNRDMFEPFVEDDENFDDYFNRMKKDGSWAGHLEVQAAALVLQRDIVIHQLNEPIWIVQNFLINQGCKLGRIGHGNGEPKMKHPLHLAYSDGMHYDSVRLLTDPGLPSIMTIPPLKTLSETCTEDRPDDAVDEDFLQVQQCSGVWDREKAHQALLQSDGNVARAVEILIENLTLDDTPRCETEVDRNIDEKINDSPSESHRICQPGMEPQCQPIRSKAYISGAMNRERTDLDTEKIVDVSFVLNETSQGPRIEVSLSILEENNRDFGSQMQNKHSTTKNKKKMHGNSAATGVRSEKPRRNAKCPCGSKIKYKNCCGIAKKYETSTLEQAGNQYDTLKTSNSMQALYI